MNLGEALQAEMDRKWGTYGEVASPANSTRGRIARMNRLERAHGGPAGAAAAVGVSRGTWVRWGRTSGRVQHPSAKNLGKLEGAYRDALAPARIRAATRGLGITSPTVSATVRWNGYYNKQAHRSVHLDRAANYAGLVAPWLAGNQAEMAHVFELVASDRFGLRDGDEAHLRFEGDDVTVIL